MMPITNEGWHDFERSAMAATFAPCCRHFIITQRRKGAKKKVKEEYP
jgi:hypothetical protein